MIFFFENMFGKFYESLEMLYPKCISHSKQFVICYVPIELINIWRFIDGVRTLMKPYYRYFFRKTWNKPFFGFFAYNLQYSVLHHAFSYICIYANQKWTMALSFPSVGSFVFRCLLAFLSIQPLTRFEPKCPHNWLGTQLFCYFFLPKYPLLLT